LHHFAESFGAPRPRQNGGGELPASRGRHLFLRKAKPLRSSAAWARLTARKDETPSSVTWLDPREASLFTGRDIVDIQKVPLHTRRERDGRNRVRVWYDAAALRQVFPVRNGTMKLALLECTLYQLRREFANAADSELLKWIGACITLRSTRG
jgi:hypothetical protein